MNELESKIINQINEALRESILSQLGSYHSPIKEMVARVISSKEYEITSLIESYISNTLINSDFKSNLQHELNQKLGKILISKFGGEIEKQVNNLRSHPETRAKLTIGMNKLIESIGQP